ncbi:hypothetical protein E2C01_045416 [Portunus trituberculatus]|uniref:Uncharacterized protein n=1 Tax=Portunus trituberculatus TaxID=210409 RepID=A0A5B7G1Z0_PORTR|nr:hypothetical protein [Portunus trituberculatus]
MAKTRSRLPQLSSMSVNPVSDGLAQCLSSTLAKIQTHSGHNVELSTLSSTTTNGAAAATAIRYATCPSVVSTRTYRGTDRYLGEEDPTTEGLPCPFCPSCITHSTPTHSGNKRLTTSTPPTLHLSTLTHSLLSHSLQAIYNEVHLQVFSPSETLALPSTPRTLAAPLSVYP